MFEVVDDSVKFSGGEWREGGSMMLEWGIGVGCDVVCGEFNVLLVKIFVILIVSEKF